MFKLSKSKKNGQWYWSLIAKNGKVICQSEGYKDIKTAAKGLRSVIKHASQIKSPNVMVRDKSDRNKYVIK